MLSIDDVLRARLKTVGVAEYKFEMESAAGREAGTEWRIIDVGGSRSQVRLLPCTNRSLRSSDLSLRAYLSVVSIHLLL